MSATVIFRMRSPLPTVLGALVLFAGCAAFFFVASPGGWPAAALGGLSVIAVGAALVATINLLRHEGWAVVLAADALELPVAPIRSARRDRIPYATIGFVGRTAPGAPPMVILHVGPRQTVRWIRQADLATGFVDDLVAQLTARVSAVRGEGERVRLSHDEP